MGGKYRKYQAYQREDSAPMRRVHPVWRGIGCLLLIIIPFTSYAASVVLLEQNTRQNWFRIPVDLLIGPGNFLYSLIPDTQLLLKAILTIVFTMVLFALFTFVTFLVSNAARTTERNDPFYVPPARRSDRRK
jgi:hypothetical protein